MMSRRLLGLVATFAALVTVPVAGTRSTFVPDWTFKGSTLDRVARARRRRLESHRRRVGGHAQVGGWRLAGARQVVSGCRVRRRLQVRRRLPDGCAAARREDADGDEGRLPLARCRRGRRLCGHARRQRQDPDARASAPRRRADAHRSICGRTGGGRRRARSRRSRRPGSGARCATGDAAQPDGSPVLRTEAERLE